MAEDFGSDWLKESGKIDKGKEEKNGNSKILENMKNTLKKQLIYGKIIGKQKCRCCGYLEILSSDGKLDNLGSLWIADPTKERMVRYEENYLRLWCFQ